MLARRRGRLGVFRTSCPVRAAGTGCPGGLLLFLLRRGLDRLRHEALALERRELLIFGPLLAQLVALLRRHLGDLAVSLPRLAALVGRELDPGLHAPLHALLLLRFHRGIALGDADPLAL